MSWLPFTKNSNRQKQDCGRCLAVEGEDEGVKTLVEGRLEDDEHTSVNDLYDDCYYVRLLGVHLIHVLAFVGDEHGGEWKEAGYICANEEDGR